MTADITYIALTTSQALFHVLHLLTHLIYSLRHLKCLVLYLAHSE